VLDYSFSNQFKKDHGLMEKRNYNMDEMYEIIVMIIWQEPLPERCKEHKLSGNYEGFTECHIRNDWLLTYLIESERVTFYRTGTHSDLF
jgi:mRNA interferase YafQ